MLLRTLAELGLPYRRSYWDSAELEADTRWVSRLSPLVADELVGAVRSLAAEGVEGIDLAPPGYGSAVDRFDLTSFWVTCKDLVRELEHGTGICIVRGFPVDELSEDELYLVSWLLMLGLGVPVSQNRDGDYVGRVRAEAPGKADYAGDSKLRGYQTTEPLGFHSDPVDILGLLCVRPAERGGESRVLSSGRAFAELFCRDRRLAEALLDPVCVHRRGDVASGGREFYVTPIFSIFQGTLSSRYVRPYIEAAQNLSGVVPLSSIQVEAMDALDEVLNTPALEYAERLGKGDLELLHNFQTFHGRSDFTDPPRAPGRDLLRMWAVRVEGLPLHPDCWSRRFDPEFTYLIPPRWWTQSSAALSRMSAS